MIRRGAALLRDLVFPPRCAACDRPLAPGGADRLCGACRSEVRAVTPPCCTACGEPFHGPPGTGHLCGRCLRQPPPFAAARASFRYEGPVRVLLQRFKYRDDGHAFRALCELARAAPAPDLPPPDLLVPVPLHPARLRERGFNQALRLSRRLFPGVPAAPGLLRRVRPTPPQARLPLDERRRNVRGAFAAAGPPPGDGRILLVDDVMTTGATLAECARVLRRAGAGEVYAYAAARAVRG
nr:ComF family protein [Dissulfurirhabdus thermomarina]